jgi:hypothetical protein
MVFFNFASGQTLRFTLHYPTRPTLSIFLYLLLTLINNTLNHCNQSLPDIVSNGRLSKNEKSKEKSFADAPLTKIDPPSPPSTQHKKPKENSIQCQ